MLYSKTNIILYWNFEKYSFVIFKDTGFECLADLSQKYGSNQFDLVIECSGNAKATQQALDVLRPGGKLCIFGVASPKSQVMYVFIIDFFFCSLHEVYNVFLISIFMYYFLKREDAMLKKLFLESC